ncbi:MAG: aminoacyl-tRNA hydrolase [bacterium]|nr:aminoacyl-tRNA hydrolase [bacterium]
MVRCVVGLGNPGKEYAWTRHNVGFRVVDTLAAWRGVGWRKGWWRKYWEAELRAPCLLLCKPATYMNRSGEAVAEVCDRHELGASDLLVVYDDVDLPLGRLRVRRGGSAGGHNGMQSIVERLGTKEIARLRVGIGRSEGDRVAYVLGLFRPEEEEVIEEAIKAAARGIELLATQPWERAQAWVNAWRPGVEVETVKGNGDAGNGSVTFNRLRKQE